MCLSAYALVAPGTGRSSPGPQRARADRGLDLDGHARGEPRARRRLHRRTTRRCYQIVILEPRVVATRVPPTNGVLATEGVRVAPRVPPIRVSRYRVVTKRALSSASSPRRRPAPSAFAHWLWTALAVFLLALVLVTGAELVIGHPLSGGRVGQTTMSALF